MSTYRIVTVEPWQSLMFWVTANKVGDPSHYFKRSGQLRLTALRLEDKDATMLDRSLPHLVGHQRAAPVLTYYLKKRHALFDAIQALVTELDVKADPDHAGVPPSDQATGIVYGSAIIGMGVGMGKVRPAPTTGKPPD